MKVTTQQFPGAVFVKIDTGKGTTMDVRTDTGAPTELLREAEEIEARALAAIRRAGVIRQAAGMLEQQREKS